MLFGFFLLFVIEVIITHVNAFIFHTIYESLSSTFTEKLASNSFIRCIAGKDLRKASLALVENKVMSAWQYQWKDKWKKKWSKYEMMMIDCNTVFSRNKTRLPEHQYFLGSLTF